MIETMNVNAAAWADMAKIACSNMATNSPIVDAFKVEDGAASHMLYGGKVFVAERSTVYLGVAASGQTQHTMGMYESGKVVVINKDTSCPFFDRVDYCLVGAYEDVVPALARALG